MSEYLKEVFTDGLSGVEAIVKPNENIESFCFAFDGITFSFVNRKVSAYVYLDLSVSL